MRVGIVIAIETEFREFRKAMGPFVDIYRVRGHIVYAYEKDGHGLFVVKSGAGEIAAAAATQMLISKFCVDLIVNFGICGGLTEEMSLFKTVIVEKVVHYDFDTSPVDGWEKARHPEYPDVYIPAPIHLLPDDLPMKRVICASSDRFVADPALRKELHELFGAEICEMEAAGILLTANAAQVPAILIKAVSDSLEGGADEYLSMASQTAELCMETLKRLELLNTNQQK